MSTVALGKLTTEQLVALKKQITDDPDSRSSGNSIYLYKPHVRRRLDEIDRTIAYQVRLRRAERGEPVNDAGHSGRQTNRR